MAERNRIRFTRAGDTQEAPGSRFRIRTSISGREGRFDPFAGETRLTRRLRELRDDPKHQKLLEDIEKEVTKQQDIIERTEEDRFNAKWGDDIRAARGHTGDPYATN